MEHEMRANMVVAIAAIGAIAACRSTPAVPTMQVKLAGFGDHARRVLLSPSARWAAVERDGDPASVELVDLPSGSPGRQLDGWALGPPDDDGALVYLTRVDDQRFQVRSTASDGEVLALDAPAGRWRVAAALGAGDALVVVLDDRDDPERRWMAAISRADLVLRATATGARAPRVKARRDVAVGARQGAESAGVGPTLALTPERLFVLGGVSDAPTGDASFAVSAFSSTSLEPLWTRALVEPPRDPAPADEPGGLVEAPPIAVEVRTWGDNPAFLVVPAGDGARVLVVSGEEHHGTITWHQSLIVVDAADGRIVASRRFVPGGMSLGGVRGGVPAPGSHVVLMHGQFPANGVKPSASTSRLGGVSRLDLTDLDHAELFPVSRHEHASLNDVMTSSIAVTSTGTILITSGAPP
jgi:hypothetical protein